MSTFFAYVFIMQKRLPINLGSLIKKLMTGLGPVTSSLPMRCATTCATSAYSVLPINLLDLLKADDGTRTRDLLITNEVRYHLCHISLSVELRLFRSTRITILLSYHFVNTFFKFFLFLLKKASIWPFVQLEGQIVSILHGYPKQSNSLGI